MQKRVCKILGVTRIVAYLLFEKRSKSRDSRKDLFVLSRQALPGYRSRYVQTKWDAHNWKSIKEMKDATAIGPTGIAFVYFLATLKGARNAVGPRPSSSAS